MSQTTTTSAEVLNSLRMAKENRLRQGKRSGPVYGEAPLVWYDQVFEREAAPTGAIECGQALRVGSTQNALDVLVVASHVNGDSKLAVAKGATLTLTMSEGPAPDGEFEEVGPTICVTAKEAVEVDADCLVARFALGNMSGPWAKAKLEVTGVSGGKVDVALGYVAR